uniref:RING-type domain-containing protein n=1 Tax=Oryza punctata TaxID=4537 RepID=A0A0E0JSV0_ORYPU
MNSHDFARRVPKRRRTNKLLSQILPDLNSLPTEGADDGGSPSSSVPVSHTQTSSVAVAGTSQHLVPAVVAGPHIGMSSFPIIVDDIDDDVVMYSASSFPQYERILVALLLTFMFQVRQQAPRTEPVVTIEDDSETTPGQAGDTVDEHVDILLSLTLGRYPRHHHQRSSNISTSPVIHIIDIPNNVLKLKFRQYTYQALPEPEKAVPKEPTFNCPVCMNELVEPSSTICGHIFCRQCIKASIQAQKKCPTCRRKLTMNNFHRVYLPSAE